jgi:hypothetical protein
MMPLLLPPVFAQAFCELPSNTIQVLRCMTLLYCLILIGNFVAYVFSIVRDVGDRKFLILRFLCLVVGLGLGVLFMISLHGIALL